MKKLSELVALRNYNGGRTSVVLAGLDYNTLKVTEDRIEDVISTIKRKENRPLKSKILSDHALGLTMPLYSPDGLAEIPSFVPMWGTKLDGKAVVAYNITQFASHDENKNIKISVKTMFGFMLGATVSRAIALNPGILQQPKLLKHLTAIYVRIITKILDKNFAITVNSLHYDQIKYLCAKFFLISVVGAPNNDTTTGIALGTVTASSETIVKSIDNDIDESMAYNDIESFLTVLAELFTRLHKLQYRLVLNELVKLYKSPTLLIAEYAPYFIANILYTIVSANINNEYTFDSVLGKDGIEVYKELDRLI